MSSSDSDRDSESAKREARTRRLHVVKRALESKSREAQLSSEKLDDEALTVLAAGLASNTTIVSLSLSFNSFGIKGMAALSEALKSNTALRDLDLANLALYDAELRALLPGLKANRGLRTLRLRGNRFNEEVGRELLAVYKEHPTLVTVVANLRSLSKKLKDEFDELSVPRSDAAMAAELTRASGALVADCSALASTTHDMSIIAKALLNNTTTTELDLGFGLGIDDNNLAPLLGLLKRNTALREIRLDGNTGISDAMKQHIKAALQRNRDLAARKSLAEARAKAEAESKAKAEANARAKADAEVKQRPLGLLFQSLDLLDYLAAFEAAKARVDDLPHLTDGMLRKLIPEEIPRDRLQRHLKQSRAADVASAFDVVKALPAQYEFKRQLGRGDFGLAVLAHDKHDNALVVIKLFKLDCKSADEAKLRIAHEATFAAVNNECNVLMRCNKAQHKSRRSNVVELIAIARLASAPPLASGWLNHAAVLEHCDGGDLAVFVQDSLRNQQVAMARSDGARLVLHLCGGLVDIHSARVMHRDIALRNVLIHGFGDRTVYKLADLGLGKQLGENRFTSSLQRGPGTTTLPLEHKAAVEADRSKADKPYSWEYDIACLAMVLIKALVLYPELDESNAEQWKKACGLVSKHHGEAMLKLLLRMRHPKPDEVAEVFLRDATALFEAAQKAAAAS